MENRLTSFELSKKFWEAGCRLKTVELGDKDFYTIVIDGEVINIPAYDLLWEGCVKYLDEFFGDSPQTQLITEKILNLLQQNKKAKAEKYFWEHSKFNEKKKQHTRLKYSRLVIMMMVHK